MLAKISVVINTLNEEANIADCIRSVRKLANEIVVCDMESEDQTVSIAKDMGAKILSLEKSGYVEPARHYAISHASHEWVLVLDADERMTPKLANKLEELCKEDDLELVVFWSLFCYFGKFVRHGGFFTPCWPRFFRKEAYLRTYTETDLEVHKNFSSIMESDVNRIVLPSAYYMEHFAYPTIESYVVKTLGMYSRIEAEQYFQQGRKFSLLRLLGRPIKVFFTSFILKQGFRDGLRGFILSVLYAGYWFTTWANLWRLEELEKNLVQDKCPADFD